MFEDFKGLSVDNLAYAIGDSGNAIVEIHLPGGDIDGFMLLVTKPVASRGEHE
jgi:hypothetical protein